MAEAEEGVEETTRLDFLLVTGIQVVIEDWDESTVGEDSWERAGAEDGDGIIFDDEKFCEQNE